MDASAENLEFERLQILRKQFWIQKLGQYPTRVERVLRKVTWEGNDKEQEQIEREFQEFLKAYNNNEY